ncbi:MAG: hypothetical protein ACI9SI_001960, partial [Polaribacter sp.]
CCVVVLLCCYIIMANLRESNIVSYFLDKGIKKTHQILSLMSYKFQTTSVYCLSK